MPGPIDFSSAKEMRFRGWAEKVGFVKYMNMYMALTPGGVNDWSDLLSRIAGKLAECAAERERLAAVMPMTVHSYHTGHKEAEATDEEVPEGYGIGHLKLDADDWDTVADAYLQDDNANINV